MASKSMTPYEAGSNESDASWRESTRVPRTPNRMNIASDSIHPETPNTLRRSSRIPIIQQSAQVKALASPTPRMAPKKVLNPDSHEYTVQMLMKLPGFDFSKTTYVFPLNQKDLATMLGAQIGLDGHKKPVPAKDQKDVAHRVTEVIEVCVDEWLDNWQDGPLLSTFWAEAAERLRCKSKYWQHVSPDPAQVFKICMRYTAAWDPNGRGCTEEEDFWGFRLGELTWGGAKAEIDPDLFAKPWDYERA
ncbi:hypothetical protein VP1G_01028 [Cytospora mali]|uniref:Uncharacterized protein n=1 Tax=Cytospora mali TaxID=578113 RepID=A0A194UPL3_CYTMA|nr:hypothetical protein VP1G_01028 [Valsa mali var. pyri (nom. inval.)]